MKTIKNGKSIRVWTFVFVLMLILLLSSMIIWTSAQDPPTLDLTITATGDFRGKGDRFRASSGEIVAALHPFTYEYRYPKTIGKVTSTISYSYEDLDSLTLVEEIMVEIRIDGSFRRLNDGAIAPITELFITGCSIVYPDGVQYCVNAGSSDIGTVTKTGPNTWAVEATFLASEQGPPSLCVAEWSEGNLVDGFCIPLYNFKVVCTGTITK